MWRSSKTVLLALILVLNNSTGLSRTRELKMRHGKTTIISVRYLPDGKRFISASYDGTVIMWDRASGKRMWTLDLDQRTRTEKGHTISNILGMALSADGEMVAVSYSRANVVGDTLQGKDEERIGLLDSETGLETRVLTGHTGLIGRLAFSPNGELLLSESGDSTARLWNVKTGQQVLVINLKEKGASVAFSPDANVLVVATQPSRVSPPQPIVGAYNAHTGQLLREFPRTKVQVTALAFSACKKLAIASGDAAGSQIDIWEQAAQAPKTTLPMPKRVIKAIAFSSDGGSLALGGYGNGKGFVEVRDVTSNSVLKTVSFEDDVTALDFSPDGKRLVVGTDKGQIMLLPL